MFQLIVILALLPLAIGTAWAILVWTFRILGMVFMGTVDAVNATDKAWADREKSKSESKS